ncbi:hypothetical protein V2H45_11985 [Tumidithrix elongata RA019]|uniref:Uncharacterized protein n=1 Tax=Tumidithrix elongata BACA0141 TaxID=2716417 RepID=A0AAW9Q2P7_9CYAN|nr:hypothetical protein [Tumidithrix elongata RA019]
MSDLTNALDRIMVQLIKKELSITECFQQGLTYSTIQELIRGYEFKFSEEVYELFQWYNGIASKCLENNILYPMFDNFNSLERALALYNKLVELNSPEFKIWNIRWLPIFSLDIKEHHFVDCSESNSKVSPVFKYFMESGSWMKYSSLTNMMLTIAECHESGIYSVDQLEDGEINESDENAIRKKHNPTAIFWE